MFLKLAAMDRHHLVHHRINLRCVFVAIASYKVVRDTEDKNMRKENTSYWRFNTPKRSVPLYETQTIKNMVVSWKSTRRTKT